MTGHREAQQPAPAPDDPGAADREAPAAGHRETEQPAAAAPAWRSLLYVPVLRGDFIERAHRRGADAVVLDLEDSIAAGEKAAARRALPAAVDRLAGRGVPVAVRINRPWRLAVRDIEAAVRPGVSALALPKVAGADHVRMLDEMITDLEGEAGLPAACVRLLAMVETAAGFQRLPEIAAASGRIDYLTLGTEDFATSVGIAPEPDLMSGPVQAMVIAARAAGVSPIGLAGSISEYRDLDAFAATVARSRRLGMVGAFAVHPAQIPVINRGFGPAPEELDRARRMVEAYDRALAAGVGAISFDGIMIDEPIVERSRRLLVAGAERSVTASRPPSASAG